MKILQYLPGQRQSDKRERLGSQGRNGPDPADRTTRDSRRRGEPKAVLGKETLPDNIEQAPRAFMVKRFWGLFLNNN